MNPDGEHLIRIRHAYLTASICRAIPAILMMSGHPLFLSISPALSICDACPLPTTSVSPSAAAKGRRPVFATRIRSTVYFWKVRNFYNFSIVLFAGLGSIYFAAGVRRMLRLSFGRDTRLSRGLKLRRTRGTWLLEKAISLTVLIEFSHSPPVPSRRQRINVVAFSGFPFREPAVNVLYTEKS